MEERRDMRTNVKHRRRPVSPLAMLIVLAALIAPIFSPAMPQAVAQESEQETALAEVPSTGARRPGPIVGVAGAVAAEEEPEGVAPIAIQVPDAGIDAAIERVRVVDGVMQNPSGPWVVSWYENLPALGQGRNVVMAGHVDYWDVGPAVFWYLKEPGLAAGQVIRVVGADQQVYEYQVQTSTVYSIDQLTPDLINNEIIGDRGSETLTLITCGGEFDVARGEYLSRIVVHAVRI
jgi:hypothetical protein